MTKKKKKGREGGARAPREGSHGRLTEMTSEIKLEGQGLSHADSWENSVTSRRKSMCKGLAAWHNEGMQEGQCFWHRVSKAKE